MSKVFPKRKRIRLENYDYSSAGMYFVTVCVKNRQALLWEKSTNVEVTTNCPKKIILSAEGKIVEEAIKQIPEHYENVIVDKYCIMPDHVHLIIFILSDESGRMISAPTLQTIVGQMKRYVSKNLGFSKELMILVSSNPPIELGEKQKRYFTLMQEHLINYILKK